MYVVDTGDMIGLEKSSWLLDLMNNGKYLSCETHDQQTCSEEDFVGLVLFEKQKKKAAGKRCPDA